MSTHDFAFGDHENTSGGDPVAQASAAIDARFQELNQVVCDFEPKVREINRALTDLFGPRPDREPWAYLGQGDDDTYRIYLTPIEMGEVLHLVANLAAIVSQADRAGASQMSSHYDTINLAHQVIGEAARFNAVPSTHVKIVRRGY